ncbi:hypothetical protein STVA_41610 [Allostella vacuolata]|nr:hypothetical protein STVA_41610 [Stella vacuolata]
MGGVVTAWPSTDDRPRRGYRADARARLLAALAEAAAAGRPCPSNTALAQLLDATVPQVKVTLQRLEAAGAIWIDGASGRGRVVTIAATGARTAGAVLPASAPRPAPVGRVAPAPVPAGGDRRRRGAADVAVRYACHSILDAPAHQVRTGCGWIDGDLPTGAWSYCNAPAEPGCDWCAQHRQRCYTLPSDRAGSA